MLLLLQYVYLMKGKCALDDFLQMIPGFLQSHFVTDILFVENVDVAKMLHAFQYHFIFINPTKSLSLVLLSIHFQHWQTLTYPPWSLIKTPTALLPTQIWSQLVTHCTQ